MKRLYFVLIILLSTVCSQAQENITLQADQAYTNQDYEQALELYQDALKLHGSSSSLYYNMGNTCYRLGDMGMAVLYYKKALKLNPTNKDAKTNLEFVQQQLTDNIENNKSWSQSVSENIMFLMTPNSWAVLGIIFFGLFLFALFNYFFGNTVGLRKIAFFGGIGSLALTVLCTLIAFETSAMANSGKEAVVISPVVQLSTVPRVPTDKAQQAFTLHEGALVEILDSLNVPTDTINPVWMEVKVNNEHRAWMAARHLEKI